MRQDRQRQRLQADDMGTTWRCRHTMVIHPTAHAVLVRAPWRPWSTTEEPKRKSRLSMAATSRKLGQHSPMPKRRSESSTATVQYAWRPAEESVKEKPAHTRWKGWSHIKARGALASVHLPLSGVWQAICHVARGGAVGGLRFPRPPRPPRQCCGKRGWEAQGGPPLPKCDTQSAPRRGS